MGKTELIKELGKLDELDRAFVFMQFPDTLTNVGQIPFGILMICKKKCKHLVAIGKTELDAWANVPLEIAGLDNLELVKFGTKKPKAKKSKK